MYIYAIHGVLKIVPSGYIHTQTYIYIKNLEFQADISELMRNHEKQTELHKEEWTSSLRRSKEIYENLIDRMKNEHESAITRLNEMKNIEMKAALSANSHAK